MLYTFIVSNGHLSTYEKMVNKYHMILAFCCILIDFILKFSHFLVKQHIRLSNEDLTLQKSATYRHRMDYSLENYILLYIIIN